MKRCPVVVGCLLALLAGPLRPQAPTLLLRSVVSDGAMRWYRVYVPPSWQAGAPTAVVLAFHGGGGNAAQFAASCDLAAAADGQGFLLVFPEGTGPAGAPPFTLQTWNAGDCCGPAGATGVDDVQFTADLIDALALEWPVDPDRVYATGFSNGGLMSYRLGLELPDRIAAIAPVGAARQVDTAPVRPMPLLAIHGALDTNVPWQGGVGSGVSGTDFTSQEDSIAPFLQVNQATLPAHPTRVVGQALLFESPAPSAAPVSYWLLLDQAHSWPGFPSTLDPSLPVNGDIVAGDVIWSFFGANPRRPARDVLGPPCGTLLSASAPVLGRTLTLFVLGAPAQAALALWVSPPVGAPVTVLAGCEVWLDPTALAAPWVQGTTGVLGGWSLPLALPAEPALHGLTVHLQGAAAAPRAGLGIELTNGLALTLGF